MQGPGKSKGPPPAETSKAAKAGGTPRMEHAPRSSVPPPGTPRMDPAATIKPQSNPGGSGGGVNAQAAYAQTYRPPPSVKPGAMIGDKYRVEREIGRGGFGVVVRAMHLTLDQRVAIKVLTEGEGSTAAEFAEDAERFRREARATAALRSDYVVRVIDVDVLESGYPYIVMEYLEGQTLHDLVYTKGPISVEDAVDYLLQILAALAEAHAAGIVHRDLKPANVLLSKGLGGHTRAKVLDFGVSKMLGAASQRLTRTGAVVGTVAYMAPEQMLDAKRVDGRADLWSAGLVLYEVLGRTHPFGSTVTGPKVVTAILKDPLVPIRSVRPDVPPQLEAVVARLLEKRPEDRFQTARAAAKALAPFAPVRSRMVIDEILRSAHPSGAAAPDLVTKPTRATRSRRSKTKKTFRRLLATVTAIALVGAVLAYLFYFRPRLFPAFQAPPPTTQPGS